MHVAERYLATTTDLERYNSRNSILSTITTGNTSGAAFRELYHVKIATAVECWFSNATNRMHVFETYLAATKVLESTMLSKKGWWNAGSRTLPIESTCPRRISLQPRFWKGTIAAIQFSALLQQETPVVRHFVIYTMFSNRLWWNAGSRTLLIESTCLTPISLPPRFWNGRIAAIQFLELRQQETPVVRHFVNYTMLSKRRWWNPGSRTLLIESTCLTPISLQPRFWKGRIAAIQFSALLQQETPVVRHFVIYTMFSNRLWWNAGSRTLPIESTCPRRISLQQRFWKGRIAAIQFSALLQQETPVVRRFVNYTMLSKRRWWNPGARTLLIESTCLTPISLPPRFWNGRIAAIQFLELRQQETPVVRHFVNYTMLSKRRWWKPGSRTLLIESTCLTPISLQPRFWKGRIAAIQFSALLQQETSVVRHFVNYTMLSKRLWWNAGIIAAIQFLELRLQEIPVVRRFVNYTMLSKRRWWNPGARTLLIESTCLTPISLPPRFWNGRIAAIQFLELRQQETLVARHFVNYTMLSKRRWWNPGARTLLIESTCLTPISLPPRFWKGRIAAIQFSALLQQETPVVRRFVNYTMLSKRRWWNPGSRTLLIESTCLTPISLPPQFWNGRIAAIQFLALRQQESPVVQHFVNYTI
ncbi:hypothetical protein ANTQUA_LOCUS10569 [Anthophora quadrimaculata]